MTLKPKLNLNSINNKYIYATNLGNIKLIIVQKRAVTARCPQAAQFVFILACKKHLFGPCLVFQSPRVCLLNLLSFFILSNRAYLIWFSLGSFV